MLRETPEEVLLHILNHVCGCPDGKYTDTMQYAIQVCLGGRLAEDFDYDDLFMPLLIMCHPARPPTPPLSLSDIHRAVVIGDDAYICLDDALFALHRSQDRSWKLQISLSMCSGCFGDHSYISAGCWGVLCQCCGGTGWQSGDLDYCVGHPLSGELELCVATDSPRTAFLRLLEVAFPLLDSIRGDAALDISQALIRGKRAKLEIITSQSRYLALLEQDVPHEWCLAAFVELCQVCGGRGRNLAEQNRPCPSCGGLKWGKAGDLRYCRNYALGWYTLQD